jgi:hypothetical protein
VTKVEKPPIIEAALKARARKVYHISELPDKTVKALTTERMSPAHDPLDKLLEN